MPGIFFERRMFESMSASACTKDIFEVVLEDPHKQGCRKYPCVITTCTLSFLSSKRLFLQSKTNKTSCISSYTEVVRLLLKSGAKVDYRPDTGEEFPRTTLCDEPLRLAIRNKHMDIARMLLEHGADPNKRYFFGSEINLVTDLEFLELLLTFGANPDSRDRSGLTPLMKAVRQPQGMEAVLLLLKYGADVNAMADERHDYRTVLHYAVLSGNLQIVNLIVKQGALLNYEDGYDLGKPSPLDLAILKGDPRIVELLIRSGLFPLHTKRKLRWHLIFETSNNKSCRTCFSFRQVQTSTAAHR